MMTTPPDGPPCPEGFYLGFALRWDSCEVCGQPAWAHAGEAKPPLDDPFGGGPWTLAPWQPGRLARIRAAWEPRRPAAAPPSASATVWVPPC